MSEAGKILVIDDEPGIREGCRRVLSAQGFAVDGAENGQEGLGKLRAGAFDLVLLDVMMPGTNGIDLLGPIHDHDPETVCIIITGYATVELAVKAIKEGAYDFITKPFSADDLIMAVNQGLERRRLSLESKRLQDVESEAKRLSEETVRLEAVDRAKMSFVRTVTHELRAPAAAILSYLRLILDGDVPPDREREVLERAATRAKAQLELIADLLEMSSLREFTMGDKVTMVNLGDTLREVVAQFEDQAREKDQHLEVTISCQLPPVRAKADRLKSVWTNLIGNAIKYTPHGGTVEVTLECTDDAVMGRVKDNGIGIPAEAQKRLFTEFFRAENAKELTRQGTGLGLAIVRQIVDGAGGRIWVESEEGKGASFTFTLPVSDAPMG